MCYLCSTVLPWIGYPYLITVLFDMHRIVLLWEIKGLLSVFLFSITCLPVLYSIDFIPKLKICSFESLISMFVISIKVLISCPVEKPCVYCILFWQSMTGCAAYEMLVYFRTQNAKIRQLPFFLPNKRTRSHSVDFSHIKGFVEDIKLLYYRRNVPVYVYSNPLVICGENPPIILTPYISVLEDLLV
jgi:hypothetical protein